MVDDQRREPVRLRPLQPRRVRTVRDDENDFCRIVGSTRCGGKRLHVRAAAGDQNGGALFRPHAAHVARAIAGARVQSRTRTKGLGGLFSGSICGAGTASSRQDRQRKISVALRIKPQSPVVLHRPGFALALGFGLFASRRDTSPMMSGVRPRLSAPPAPLAPRFAATTTMPMPQLNVRSISASSRLPVFASQPNTAGAWKDERSIRAATSFGRTRGNFRKSAAGDMRQRLDSSTRSRSAGRPDRSEKRFDVDARRRQQRFGDRVSRSKRRRRLQSSPAWLTSLRTRL